MFLSHTFPLLRLCFYAPLSIPRRNRKPFLNARNPMITGNKIGTIATTLSSIAMKFTPAISTVGTVTVGPVALAAAVIANMLTTINTNTKYNMIFLFMIFYPPFIFFPML